MGRSGGYDPRKETAEERRGRVSRRRRAAEGGAPEREAKTYRDHSDKIVCTGFPEVGSCERPAQTRQNHRAGRWSPRYCRRCDEVRLLHMGRSSELVTGDEDEAERWGRVAESEDSYDE